MIHCGSSGSKPQVAEQPFKTKSAFNESVTKDDFFPANLQKFSLFNN
jgi:hypothetical protein